MLNKLKSDLRKCNSSTKRAIITPGEATLAVGPDAKGVMALFAVGAVASQMDANEIGFEHFLPPVFADRITVVGDHSGEIKNSIDLLAKDLPWQGRIAFLEDFAEMEPTETGERHLLIIDGPHDGLSLFGAEEEEARESLINRAKQTDSMVVATSYEKFPSFDLKVFELVDGDLTANQKVGSSTWE